MQNPWTQYVLFIVSTLLKRRFLSKLFIFNKIAFTITDDEICRHYFNSIVFQYIYINIFIVLMKTKHTSNFSVWSHQTASGCSVLPSLEACNNLVNSWVIAWWKQQSIVRGYTVASIRRSSVVARSNPSWLDTNSLCCQLDHEAGMENPAAAISPTYSNAQTNSTMEVVTSGGSVLKGLRFFFALKFTFSHRTKINVF